MIIMMIKFGLLLSLAKLFLFRSETFPSNGTRKAKCAELCQHMILKRLALKFEITNDYFVP